MGNGTSDTLGWLTVIVSVLSVIVTAIATAFTVSWRLNGRLTKIESDQKLLEANIFHKIDLLESRLNQRFDGLESDNEAILEITTTHLEENVVIQSEMQQKEPDEKKIGKAVTRMEQLHKEGAKKLRKHSNRKKEQE